MLVQEVFYKMNIVLLMKQKQLLISKLKLTELLDNFIKPFFFFKGYTIFDV